MIVTKVMYCSVLINLLLASNESSPETSLYCKKGGVNITHERELFKQLLKFKKHPGLPRELEVFDYGEHVNLITHEDQEIPKHFDARQKWPMCWSLFRVKDQSYCGTCWAFVSGTVASDRLCIASNGSIQFDVSQHDIITCCKECFLSRRSSRCNTGGSLIDAIMYIIKYGVVDEDCKPYHPSRMDDGCEPYCEDRRSYKTNKLNISSMVIGSVEGEDDVTSTLKDIQIDIMKYGPVAGYMLVLKDFKKYTDQVYIDNNGPEAEGEPHSIKIIGWGIEKGTPYWLCANSWGREWGRLGGFFKIRRGSNEVGIEEMFVATDTNPESRPITEKYVLDSSSSSFTKILHFYKITIVVILALNV